MKTYHLLTILLIGSASTMFILWMWSLRRSSKKIWQLILPVKAQENHPQVSSIEPARYDATNDVPAIPKSEVAEASQINIHYKDIFLKNDGARARVSAYVNRDVHEKFKRLLSIVAPDVTISSFINNVLNHHLEQFRDEISEMYHNEFDKPF